MFSFVIPSEHSEQGVSVKGLLTLNLNQYLWILIDVLTKFQSLKSSRGQWLSHHKVRIITFPV